MDIIGKMNFILENRVKKAGRRGLLSGSLFLCCLLALAGCGKKEADNGNTVSVYYISNSETKVENHGYAMQGGTVEEQLGELLACLSAMPEKSEYKAPLAMGFQVLGTILDGEKLTLDVTKSYKAMPATTEVLVRAALVRTLTQIAGIRYVGITVEGEQLHDNMGEPISWMNAEQFINNDGNEINTYELVRMKLYFANAEGDKLIAAYREKHYSTNTPLERFVVEELIAGPGGQAAGLYPSINPETKIISIMTKDGICYVNLDAGFLNVTGNVSVKVAVYSIVNSLVELSHINKVQILVDGQAPVNFFNANTFERDLDYVIKLEP